MTSNDSSGTARRGAAIRLAALALAALALHLALGPGLRETVAALPHGEAGLRSAGLWAAVALYALLLALPFVPGVEIGIGLLAMFGAAVAPHVYLATVFGLALAFLGGRMIPPMALARGARALGLDRAADLAAEIAPLAPGDRLAHLLRDRPGRWVELLIRHRYLALAILLNLPGNAVIGGGGAIAMAAGASRLFNIPTFLGVVALAVSPVPILVWSLSRWNILP